MIVKPPFANSYGPSVVLALMILAGAGASQAADPAPAAPAAARAFKDENLIAAIPRGYKVGSSAAQGPVLIAEYVPTAETVDNWTSIITVQIYRNLTTVTPDKFASDLADRVKGACPGAEARKLVDSVENGYAMSVWTMACPLNPQTHKPETLSIKVIRGQDALYSVQYAYRETLTPERQAPAMAFLGRVLVCDTRKPDRACPAPLTAGAGPAAK